MKFAEPLWLLAGLAVCALLAWSWRRHDIRQRAALAVFASKHLHEQLVASFSVVRRRWKRGLFLASMALLFVALARPQFGFNWIEMKRRGIEILFAVDTSKSMLTPDAKPDRLTRAKLAVDDFVGHLDGDGVGLVAFAGTAFLQCPITLDYDAFDESLDALDTNTIPRGGTDISSAIREAEAAFQDRKDQDKILILLTDGEDLEGNAIDTARAAAGNGLKIFTVGVGTANGDLIPLPPEDGGGFVRDSSGQYVKSHLDEATLRAIAQATGGIYAPLGANGQGLAAIQKVLTPLAKHELSSRRERVYIERYQWPLTASLVLLLASLTIGTRRNVRRKSSAPEAPPVPRLSRRSRAPQAVAAFVGLALLASPSHARASISDEADAAYKKGDYAAAQKEYAEAAQKHPDKNLLQFDAGTAAYKAGQYTDALQDFQKAVSGAKESADPAQIAAQQSAYYNLGNTLYRTGQKTEQGNKQQTIQAWQQAVKSYDAALQIRSDDADAKFNRDFVQHKLDELQKQQQQQQQKQNQQSQSQNQNQQNQSQQNQSAQNQNQKNQQNQSQSQSAQNQNQNQQNQTAQSQQNKSGGQSGQQQQQANNQNSQQQNGQSQQAQNQPQNSGQQPQNQNATAQNSGQQNQPGQQQQNQQQASNGPQGSQNQPQPNQPNGQEPGSSSDSGSSLAQNGQPLDETGHTPDQAAPGQMTKEEARQLLDSLRDEQRDMPGTPIARSGNPNPSDQPPAKDW